MVYLFSEWVDVFEVLEEQIHLFLCLSGLRSEAIIGHNMYISTLLQCFRRC